MRSRFALYTLIATLVIGGVAFAADAFVVSDREQLEMLAHDLTEGDGSDRMDAVLRWTDPSREPVTLTRGRETTRFEEQDDYALSEQLGEALAPFGRDELEVVQRSVRVDGDRGTVAVRVRADGELYDATMRLVRSGQGWLITDVRAR